MRMKKVVAFVVAFAVAFGGISYTEATKNQAKAEMVWKLAWSDEFDGTSLNTNTWNYEIGNGDWGWGNGEKQYYTNRTENVEVSNGTLKIKALKESYNGFDYTSGRITTKGKQEFKYGKIEARIKLPSFSGSWPAFWTLGANHSSVGWPRCGELDIMEGINAENNTYGAIHWNVESTDYNGQGDNSASSAGKLPSDYERTEWHTYGIEWSENLIRWYVDDKVFFSQSTVASSMSEFRQAHYIILNLAIGGTWPGYNIDESAFPNNSVMEVDYVRVYNQELVEETTTTTSDETVKVGKTKVKKANKNSAKTVQVSLKKISGAKGYNVKISSSKNFKKAQTVTKNVKKINFKITSKKFKNKKKLYVKARAYKVVNGKKVYGSWSKRKTVKIKK